MVTIFTEIKTIKARFRFPYTSTSTLTGFSPNPESFVSSGIDVRLFLQTFQGGSSNQSEQSPLTSAKYV